MYNKGLRQGDIYHRHYLKCMYHKFSENGNNNCCTEQWLYKLDTFVYSLLFTDGQVLIVSDEDEVDYITNKLQLKYENCGFTINITLLTRLCFNCYNSLFALLLHHLSSFLPLKILHIIFLCHTHVTSVVFVNVHTLLLCVLRL